MADQEPEKKYVDPKDATEHGYHGYVLDPVPNEDYTVAGVTKAAREQDSGQDSGGAKPSRSRSKDGSQ